MADLKGVHDELDDEVAEAGDEEVPEDEVVDRDPTDGGEGDSPEDDDE